MDAEIGIVGGGLVGLAASLSFSLQGRSVKLFEANSYTSKSLKQQTPDVMDARSIALSYSTIQIFRSLGLWADLQKECAAIKQIHVSSAGHFGVTRMNAQDINLPVMGQVIEYHTLLQALLTAVEKDPNVEVLSPVSVDQIHQHESGVTLSCTKGEQLLTIETGILVVADGASSKISEQLSIATQTVDYQQNAIVANLKVKQDHSGCAYERFTSHGPMAMLPLPGNRYAMVWTNTPESTEQLMALSDEAFIEKIYTQFGYRLGFFESLGRRDSFPLKMRRASQLVSDRCVLIGNAANTLHPVAGQGFNLGMRDIAVLFDVISGQSLDQTAIQSHLETYAGSRISDHQKTVGLGNGLVELFSNDLPVLNHLRAGALALMDVCPTLKNEMSWQGMGFGSTSASLMRGSFAGDSFNEGLAE